jgi:RecA/RadA recombinase
VAHALGDDAVDAYAFALARALEPDANFVARICLNGCADMKSFRAETDEILVARTSRGSQDLQIVNRLQQIRLSLAVVADHHQAVGGRRNLDVCKIPKVARDEAGQSRC